jgi:hypothetical protein
MSATEGAASRTVKKHASLSLLVKMTAVNLIAEEAASRSLIAEIIVDRPVTAINAEALASIPLVKALIRVLILEDPFVPTIALTGLIEQVGLIEQLRLMKLSITTRR